LITEPAGAGIGIGDRRLVSVRKAGCPKLWYCIAGASKAAKAAAISVAFPSLISISTIHVLVLSKYFKFPGWKH
jgi:hypothetical protein